MEENKQLSQEEYKEYIEQWKLDNKELVDSGKCRKVFIGRLPVYKDGRYKNKINWNKCINYKIHFIYEDIEDDLIITNCIKQEDCKNKIEINYNKSTISLLTDSFIKCGIGKLVNKITVNFKVEIGTRFKEKNRDIIITDREYRKEERIDKQGRKSIVNRKWYKYTCNVCGWTEGWIIENDLLREYGCTCCSGRTVVIGINDISTTHPHLVKYFKNIEDVYKYTYSSHNKIIMKCPDCGFEKEMMISNLYKQSFSCPRCGDSISYPEKIMCNILHQLNIDFQTQLTKTTFSWCNSYKYDFYFELNNEDFICEVNGIQHYEENFKKIKGARTLKKEQKNDSLKKELALNNGIKEENYIVIDCRYSELKFIKNNILNSRLKEIFDLSKIDWFEVGECACSSLVKKACEIKRNNPNLTCLEIGNFMKLSFSTIIKYLKQGSDIWDWINYDAKEEKRKTASKNGQSTRKIVEIFKDGVSLGIFPSAIELDRQSEKLFGVKLIYSGICQVCRNEIKQYKGYTFKYVLV